MTRAAVANIILLTTLEGVTVGAAVEGLEDGEDE